MTRDQHRKDIIRHPDTNTRIINNSRLSNTISGSAAARSGCEGCCERLKVRTEESGGTLRAVSPLQCHDPGDFFCRIDHLESELASAVSARGAAHRPLGQTQLN